MLTLTHEPTHYPDCCLSLCLDLFTGLNELVRDVSTNTEEENVILSVGCGTGLFESMLSQYLLQDELTNLKVEGVEVTSAVVKHLTTENVHRVHGTKTISQRAATADILLFVYPREGELVKQYLTQGTHNIRLVLWLGPRADWNEQLHLFHAVQGFHKPEVLEGLKLAPYEIAVAYRSSMEAPKRQDKFMTGYHGCSRLDIDSI